MDEGAASGWSELRVLLVEKFVGVHLPNIINSCCQGLITPVIPVFARSMGATDAAIGLITACIGLGRVATSIPGGLLTHRYGVRRVMVGGMLLALVGVLVVLAAASRVTLALAALVWGASVGIFFIARHPFLAAVVEKSKRGRLMAFVGGGNRWGFVFGPLLGGVLMEWGGGRLAWAAQAPLIVMAALAVWNSHDVQAADARVQAAEHTGRAAREEAMRAREGPQSKTSDGAGGHMLEVLRAHGRLLVVLGVFASTVLGMRMNRRMMLPLAAMNIGLPASYVGAIVSVSFFIDASLFFVGGMIMDRYGRKAALLPTSAALGLAFFALAVAHSKATLLLAAVLFGLAETTGSGVLLTLIADHTPPDAGIMFMSILRMAQDCGQMLWPIVLGAVTTQWSFRVSCCLMGTIGLLNTLWALRLIPETHERTKQGTASVPAIGGVEAPCDPKAASGSTESAKESARHEELDLELRLSFCVDSKDS